MNIYPQQSDYFPKRLLAIGDIHGCYGNLVNLMNVVSPKEGDQFIFLGDYIDRGPNSPGVVDYLIDFRKEYSCIFLLGNHEDMLLKYEDNQVDTFLYNGGKETLRQYRFSQYDCIPDHHHAFFRSLKPYYETDDFIFVHAGLFPGINLYDQRSEDMVWLRDEFLNSDYDWGKTIVYGHTVLNEPLLTPNRIGLDTGAVFDGKLTCCDVFTRDIWQG